MKSYKRLIFIVVTFLFLFLGCMNVLQNTRPFTKIGNLYLGGFFRPLKWYKINNIFDLRAYGFNKPSSKDAVIVDF